MVIVKCSFRINFRDSPFAHVVLVRFFFCLASYTFYLLSLSTSPVNTDVLPLDLYFQYSKWAKMGERQFVRLRSVFNRESSTVGGRATTSISVCLAPARNAPVAAAKQSEAALPAAGPDENRIKRRTDYITTRGPTRIFAYSYGGIVAFVTGRWLHN